MEKEKEVEITNPPDKIKCYEIELGGTKYSSIKKASLVLGIPEYSRKTLKQRIGKIKIAGGTVKTRTWNIPEGKWDNEEFVIL